MLKRVFNKLIGHDSEVDHDVTHWIDYGKPFGIIQSPIYQVIIGHVSIPDTLDYHEKKLCNSHMSGLIVKLKVILKMLFLFRMVIKHN